MTEVIPEHVPEPPEPDEGQDPEGSDDQQLSLRSLVTALLEAPRDADQLVASAVAATRNEPGTCLMWSRQRALIPARWGTAAIASQHVVEMRTDRPQRGGYGFWIGGSKGFGHVAPFITDDYDVRSTDAGGSGIVATRKLAWFGEHWPSLKYVGWANNVNGYFVPGVIGDWFDMARTDEDVKTLFREVLQGQLTDEGKPLHTLLERTNGLRVSLNQLALSVKSLDEELDGMDALATRQQIKNVRSDIASVLAKLT